LVFFFFQKKEAKSVCSASQKPGRPNFRKSRPCPQKTDASVNILLLFQEKEAKSGSSASQKVCRPKSRRSRPWEVLRLAPMKQNSLMLSSFPEKKQKRYFCFAEGLWAQISAKPTLGVWGLAPKKRDNLMLSSVLEKETRRVLLFQKRSKSVSSASRKVCRPKLGEADPRGLEANPKKR
jgi:hypothetical protein